MPKKVYASTRPARRPEAVKVKSPFTSSLNLESITDEDAIRLFAEVLTQAVYDAKYDIQNGFFKSQAVEYFINPSADLLFILGLFGEPRIIYRDLIKNLFTPEQLKQIVSTLKTELIKC